MLIYVDICQYMLIYVIAHHKTGKVCQSFKIELLKWSYRADLCNHFCNLFEVSSTNRTRDIDIQKPWYFWNGQIEFLGHLPLK